MGYTTNRKLYSVAGPLSIVGTLPIDVAKSGYDDITDDIKETAEYGPKVEPESPYKSFSEYTPGATNTEKAGQAVGGLVGTGTGAALGGAVGTALGAGYGVSSGIKSATKAGTSKLAGALKGAGKAGLIAGTVGALAGGIVGSNKGKSLGARTGEKIHDVASSIGKDQKLYSELTTFTVDRRTYSGLYAAVKAGVNLAKTKAGSALKPVLSKLPEPVKDVGKFTMKHKGSIIGGTLMGAGMTGGSYVADKMIQNDMKKNNQQLPNVDDLSQKSYSVITAVGKGAEKVLGGISSFMGGGGKKGVQEFANYMKSSKNATSQKIGKFVENHPKTSLIGSAGVGMGVMGATFGQGEKLSRKAIKAVDKDAFKYTESKEQQIN